MNKPTLNPVTPRRLAHEVRVRLEDMILTGDLQSGDVLNERRLAEMLQVSRTPLRDALLMLESEGLLRRRGARYLEVRQITVPEYMQVLNIRRLLEPEAVRLCIGRIDLTRLAELRSRLAELRKATGKGHKPEEFRTGAEIDAALHEEIAAAAGNPLMADMIADLRRRTRGFDIGRIPERAASVYQEHMDIVVAIEAGDAQAAVAAMTKHIDNVKASIIQHLQKI